VIRAIRRAGALVFVATGFAACDVSVTVGYNDDGGSITPASCSTDAPIRTCAEHACVVTEIGVAQMGKETVAVDGDFVYFVSPDDVLAKMPKGGGAIVELANVVPNLERITLDQDNVYWTEYDGNIHRVPKAGGGSTLVTKIFGHPISIASHEGDLYVAMTDSGEIAKVTKSSGAETRLAGQNWPVDLSLDAEHVYWINQGQSGAMNGELVRAPLGNLAGAEVVLTGLDEPIALGVAADAIVWATYDKVFRFARQGGEPQAFEAPFGDPKGVTELDGVLYVAGESGVFRIRIADGSALALDPRGFTGLALGCEGLFLVGWYESVLLRYGP